jgi:hypothetical protein
MQVRTDAGDVMKCQCALIKTLYDYCPQDSKQWWPSTAEIGTKLLYPPSPEPVIYAVPSSHILGKLPLVPAGDHGTIPRSINRKKQITQGKNKSYCKKINRRKKDKQFSTKQYTVHADKCQIHTHTYNTYTYIPHTNRFLSTC